MGIRAPPKKSSGLLCCSLWRVAAANCCSLVVPGLLLWSRGAWCSSVLCARALLALRCDALRCVVLCALLCSCALVLRGAVLDLNALSVCLV